MHNRISDHPSHTDDDDNNSNDNDDDDDDDETHYDTKIEIVEMFMHVYYLYRK